MRTLAVLATLCAATGLAFGQELISDGGFEGAFIENPDLYADIGAETGVSTESNVLFEWFGGVAWDLPNDYGNGQYGMNKAPRDFTSSRFGGTVPAFQSNSWFVAPDGEQLVGDGQEGPDDHYITGGSNRWSWFIVDAPLAGSADQEGIRLKVSYDYIGDDDRTHMAVYGLNNNNQARKPFFNWDKDSDGNSLENEVLAGPDIVTIWMGNKTGQELQDLRSDQPESSTWATYSKSFFVDAPDSERNAAAFDQIALGWRAYADPGETSALDNVSLKWIHPGDANEDLDVDVKDLIIWNANKFGQDKAWTEGDFNGDANVDVKDLIAWNANKFQSYDLLGEETEDIADVIYDLTTGELKLVVNSAEVQAGVTVEVAEEEVVSVAEVPGWTSQLFGDSIQAYDNDILNNGNSLTGEVVLATLSAGLTAEDFGTVSYGIEGGSQNTVVSVVPEPMTMSLLAIGGLAAIRRRR
jgi:hypothetical protein